MSWVLVKAEEFEGVAGSPPDPANWFCVDDKNYEAGTLNWYRPQNVVLDGHSHVVLTAKPEVYDGYAYTSGHMETQTAPLHNLWQTPADNWAVEASVQLPTGKGVWPAGPWFLGSDWNFAPPPGRAWPACGEVDHNEWYGIGRNQIRIGMVRGDGSWNENIVTLPFNVDEGFHSYRTECYGGTIRCLVDGMLYKTFTKADVPNWMGTYDQPMILIAQVEVGGNGGSPDATTMWPARLLIDYIRMYAWAADPILPVGGQRMNAIQALNKSGGWNVLGTDLYAYSAPVWAEYSLDFGLGGNQAIEVHAVNYGSLPIRPGYVFKLDTAVGGGFIGTLSVDSSGKGQLNASLIMGVQTVRLTWINDDWQQGVYDANLRLQTVGIVSLSGTPVPPVDGKTQATAYLKAMGWSDAAIAAVVNP